MERFKIKEQFLVNKKGKPISVIIPFNQYQQLLEDIHDLAIVAERREEPVLSWDNFKKKLNTHEI